jgi:hypothetical protein
MKTSGVKKERVGLGGSRMGMKENKIAKAGRPCSWECYEKNWNKLLFRNIFFLEILINVKSCQSKLGRQDSLWRAPRRTGLLYLLEIVLRWHEYNKHYAK